MPLNALVLESRLISDLAPNNPGRFYSLLSEADEKLLNAGRWRWTRTLLTLTPNADNQVVLPQDYESIVGARIGDSPTGIGWQELEFYDMGPGLVKVDGCRGQLIDQGLIEMADGNLSFDLEEEEYAGTLIPSVEVNGHLSWSTTGAAAAPDENLWVRVYWNSGAWKLDLYEDEALSASWSSVSTAEVPDGLAWTGTGDLSVTASTGYKRVYKLVDDESPAITALVRYAARPIEKPSDVPRCQSFSALKQTMLSLIYEEANDLERAVAYFSMAMDTLDKQESS